MLSLLSGTACTTEPPPKASTSARIEIDRPTALVDEPIRIRVAGLRPGEHVTVTSQAVDHEDLGWSARAQFTADGKGAVDLARQRPVAGTFRHVDGMGLFWSMRPQRGEADESWFFSDAPARKPSYEVRIAVRSGKREIAHRVTTRQWRADGVRHKQLTVADDRIDGMLFLPRSGASRKAPVLLIGGSEGGRSFDYEAALLASRGHPALSICYFACKGRPKELRGIDLEYFARAARLLQSQSSAAPDGLAVLGASRGSEAAQLLAQYYPHLVRDAVVLAPGTRTFSPGGGSAADLVSWTRAGRPIRLDPIPLNRVRGTVLAVAGKDDRLWPSADAAASIAERINASGTRHQALIYDAAGHGGAGVPYQATGRWMSHPVSKQWIDLGGTPAADARSKADSWPRILQLLDR
ncbi:acyl-CoA thioesterase/bile acid-CoA:amino acid N-acyltransferase family protein [Streptomyces sp. NBC_01304]|uniref:acyl-CoA thioesterase/bile acid-CoA:amino acid N-acyltransferase family protein n=1 Tax=Streptomyces sp. NBC_01304 TaxID=2903818 RepID=UPI002E135921|nr:acyl-CoA thioesterase/BAAT N-terminal domain-containing protein [Streptomyces sp. NBC_01304]